MMQTMFATWREKCLVLVTVLATAGATASTTCIRAPTEPDWNMLHRSDTLTLYEPANSTGPPQLTASVRWRASPEQLYRVIWDYAHFREHIPGVEKSEVLQTEDGRKWVYQQLKLPGPLKDRHYVLESSNSNSRPDQQHYRVEWKLSQRFPLPTSNLVSPSIFSGCWDIRPSREGGLLAQYSIRLDPAGNIPHWMARRGMRRYVKQLLEHLHNQLQAPAGSTL